MKALKKWMRKPMAWALVVALVLAGSLAAADSSWYDTVLGGVSSGDGSLAGDAGSAGANQGAAGEGEQQPGSSLIGGSVAINNKLTWEKINAIPVKTENMDIDEARQLCVDFFRLTKTTLWTPSENIKYIKNTDEREDAIYSGIIYGGLPYVTEASGNVYRLMDYIDESTGVVDMRDALNLTTENSMAQTLPTDRMKYFGGQCSLSGYWGWGRVVNSISDWWTVCITPAHGFVMLADYDTTKLTDEGEKTIFWRTEYNQAKAVEDNGLDKMCEAYAKLLPADGLVNVGHTIMCASKAEVVKTGGKIDADASYITIIDQSQSWENFTNEYGDNYQRKYSVDAKMTFRELFTEGYFPFTFKEFVGEDDIEKTEASFSHTGSTITKSQLFSGTVTANYGISDVYAIVTNAAGEEVYRHVARAGNGSIFTLDLAETGANVDSWGAFPSGTNTVEVVVQLSTGERITLYTGNLVN